MRRPLVALVVSSLLLAAACGDDADNSISRETRTPKPATTSTTPATTEATASETTDGADDPRSDATLTVPEEYASIQAAVDAARPGDLVLVTPGVYNEAVNVTTDELTIRGLDRNEVILDGEFTLDNGIRVLGATGVAVENMTAMNYTKNGFFWTGVDGYRGSYLTAYRTGDYGIYAFDSVNGLFEQSYAAGSPDAGFYIGQCYPCNAVIDAVISEHNGLGYSGTNAGGNLFIVNSTFRNNRAGIVPNSGSYELCYPERETTIVGNLVYSNNQPDTPAIDVALLAMGNGILPAGGVRNLIARNRIWDHDKTGIGLVPFLEEDPNDTVPSSDEWDRPCSETKSDPPPDPSEITGGILWDPQDNQVIGNVLRDNRAADLGIGSGGTDISTLGNCWSDNDFETAVPADLETLAPCDGEGSGVWGDQLDVVSWLVEVATRPASVPYEDAPLPDRPVLASMPDAATAPARPAVGFVPAVDIDAIGVPAEP